MGKNLAKLLVSSIPALIGIGCAGGALASGYHTLNETKPLEQTMGIISTLMLSGISLTSLYGSAKLIKKDYQQQ